MRKWVCASLSLIFLIAVCLTEDALAKRGRTARPRGAINAHSAVLVDMGDGRILYEQDPDATIAPASITKVLTLYIVFDALRDGRLHSWENVRVSSRAAQTGGSRMGLKTGHIVAVEELIKGMAVVSGNDACVAIAEHMSGSVEEFVRVMNNKARELGMTHTRFTTPNGLPSPGQYSTARDIAKLSVAYLRRFPESLSIHSMQSYTYRTTTHRNANRLLGTCPGVDGLKTGFVCSAGYNQSATCKRGETRLLAVVLGAPSPGVRATETARLLELGYQAIASGSPVIRVDDPVRVAGDRGSVGTESSGQAAGPKTDTKRLSTAEARRSARIGRTAKSSRTSRGRGTSSSTQHQVAAGTCAPTASSGALSAAKDVPGKKDKIVVKGKATVDRSGAPPDSGKQKGATDRKVSSATSQGTAKPLAKQAQPTSSGNASKAVKSSSARSKNIIQGSDKPPAVTKSKDASATVKSGASQTSSTAAKKKRTL
ncbi:MAG: serine hydrolase [Syntrophobacteraceae bacterium]